MDFVIIIAQLLTNSNDLLTTMPGSFAGNHAKVKSETGDAITTLNPTTRLTPRRPVQTLDRRITATIRIRPMIVTTSLCSADSIISTSFSYLCMHKTLDGRWAFRCGVSMRITKTNI